MMAYATLKEKKRIARPEADLNGDEIRELLRSDEKQIAAATGELCLAGRMPDITKQACTRRVEPAHDTTGNA